MKYLLSFFFSLSLIPLPAQDRLSGELFATRSEVIAPNAMAATSQPLCTQVALDILKAGGSAVDAAIAANACLGLMEPTGCGIGGDLFAIVWDADTEKLYGLNSSGPSPMALSRDYFVKNEMERIPYRGPLSVSVPGAVDGWFRLHDRFGKLEMEQILAPAIRYARNGFPLSEYIAELWAMGVKTFRDKPNFAETFMIDGRAPAKGEIFKNPRLAATYQKLAQGGRDAFYQGEIAETIDRAMQEAGGFLSKEDLAAFQGEWVDPVSINYRGYDIWELPPNGQGIAALQMLTLLEGFDIAAMGFGSEEYIHTFTEAKKLAFEDRAKFYADPNFNQTPIDWLLSEEYAARRRALIGENAAREYPAGELERGETIYLTVADSEGNMVSLIQSNYAGMGSGIVPGELGFMLQNRGALFSLEEGHYNVFEPGKRPFHTIIPAFITRDGKPWISFGLMGGAMQPQGHAQIVINLIDFGMNLQEAGDAPRIRHIGSSQPTGSQMTDGGTLQVESGISPQVIRQLWRRGHQIQWDFIGYGGYQAIMHDEDQGVYYGASESRKDGQAAGY
jgi:gamma-glutamyltranspeptidase/glutathione hydrolase